MGKKVFLSIIIIILAVFINVPICTATVPDVIADPNAWKPASDGTRDKLPSKVEDIVGNVLGAIQTIGIVVSVIALMLIGIKTMYGSVEEKSAYKEALPGYILGLIMVVAITTIPNLIYSVINS